MPIVIPEARREGDPVAGYTHDGTAFPTRTVLEWRKRCEAVVRVTLAQLGHSSQDYWAHCYCAFS